MTLPNPNSNLNLLWLSNHGSVGTGYGVETKLFAPLLKARGYGIAVAAMYGAEGFISTDEHGITQLPRLTADDPLMNNVIKSHIGHVGADIVLTFLDAWALNEEVYGKLNWCAWAPIDSTPMTPANKDALKRARWIWAMSRHGEAEMHKAGFGGKTMYVPLATDTEVYKPVDRDEARQKLGKAWNCDLTEKFLVVMNSANKGRPSRKGFYEALKAFAQFSRDFEDTILYIHTDILGLYGGEQIADIIELVGCDPTKLRFPEQYKYQYSLFSENYLNYVYNAADVFLSTSHGEGFGIPIIEAQAAGCPVILTDCTAMTELCRSGWLIKGGTDFMHLPGATQRLPDVDEVGNALVAARCAALGDKYLRQEHWRNVFSRERAREKALAYDYRAVFDNYMKPALDRIAADLNEEQAVETRRAELRKKYGLQRNTESGSEHPDADAQSAGGDGGVPQFVGIDAAAL